MKRLLLSLALFGFSLTSFASHVFGGQVYWEALGNNQYILHLELMGDSLGAAMPSTNSIIVNGGGINNMSVAVPYVSHDIMLCSGSTNNWTLHKYASQPVTLQNLTGPVTFTWTSCCLPTTVNVSGSPAIYLTSTMYPSGFNLSSSRFDLESFSIADYRLPVFSTTYNVDSTHVEMITAQTSSTASATYNTGYTFDKPFSSADNFDGSFFQMGSSTTQGNYLFAFKQQNFGLGGTMNSDVRFTMARPLPHNQPGVNNDRPYMGVTNSALWSTADTLRFTITASPGDTVSLRVLAQDNDFLPNFTPQSITASLSQAPGVGATITPVSPQSSFVSAMTNTVDFEWVVPSTASGQNTFYVKMRDNNCPVNGLSGLRLDVNVNNPNVPVSNYVICQGASALLVAPTSGTTYEWSPAIGLSATNTAAVTATPSSTTTYTVKVDGAVAGVFTVSPTQQITPIASQPQTNQIELDNPGDFTQHAFLYYYVPFAIDDTIVTVNQSGIYHIAGRNGFCYSVSAGVSVLPDTANGVYLISSPLNDPNNTVFDNQSTYAMDIIVGAADAGLKVYEILIPGAELSQKMGSLSLKTTDMYGNVSTVVGQDVGVGIKFAYPVGLFLGPNQSKLELIVDSGSVEIPMVEDVSLPYYPSNSSTYVEVSGISGSSNGQAITDDMIPFVFRGSLKVGVEEYHQNALTIYPQPADDFITVEGELEADYTIVDLNGRVLSQGHMMEGRIDVSELNTGVYVLQLQKDSNVYTSRIAVR